jgi:hypothetical protein
MKSYFGAMHRPVAAAAAIVMVLAGVISAQAAAADQHYLDLSTPQQILTQPQAWEGDQQPHTLSVVELDRGGYKYWGWYGLNMGRGIGLARSNDLVHWTKYDRNPVWKNARWASVLKGADPAHPDLLYFAITRDYDTPTSHIVLAKSTDGVQLSEVATLVKPVTDQRNQNPNLFHDPVSGNFFLTFYRGNDQNHFEIVSKSAPTIQGLADAPEKVLMRSTTTVAAPTLLYVPGAGADGSNLYYLATEIYPERYVSEATGWEVKVFYSDSPDGTFRPVVGNPVQAGGRACLFQFIFNGTYYGYQSHLNRTTDQWEMEVITAPITN